MSGVTRPPAVSGSGLSLLTESLDNDSETPPKFKGLREAAAYFKFHNTEALQQFFESNLWKPYADAILDNVIIPERNRAADSGTLRTRSANFATVEAILEEGEAAGRARYSDDFPDTSKFVAIDWYCYAMCKIRLANTSKHKGLFYGKPHLRKHHKLCAIWSLLQIWFYEQTPSRVKKKEKAARKRAAKDTTETTKRQRIANHAPSSGTQSSQSADLTQNAADSQITDDDLEVNSDTERADETEDRFPDNPNAALHKDKQFEADNHVANKSFPPGHLRNIQPDAPEQFTRLTDMHLERASGRPAPRTSRYDMLMAVQKGWLEPRLIDDQVYQLANANRVADDEAWQRQVEQMGEDNEAPKADPALPFHLARDDEKEIFIHNQTLLDNTASQPQGHQLACDRMGIPDADFPNYPSMPLTQSFKHWQVVGFDWIHQKRRSGLNGVLICDSMGLGKTWEIVGYMLSSLHLRREAIARGETVSRARPFLVITPPGILPNQWASEIQDITTELECIKYWGELGDTINSSRKKILTKKDSLFNGDEDNASNVIITTYHTWRRRHGPQPQESYHIKKLKWTSERATREFQLSNKSWPHNLSGVFEAVIADEATYIKSVKSQAHLAIKWLNAFTILVTATPDINSVNDFKGYISFIEPSPDTLATEVHATLTVGPSLNPYKLPRASRQGSLLRCTSDQFQKWVLDQNDPVQQGAYLAVLYGDCMIRRSHVSNIDGKMIGDDIPALKHRRAECEWLVRKDKGIDEHALYKRFAKPHVRSLIRVDEHGNVTWNWKHYRILVLISTWIGYIHIEEKMHAESVPSLMEKGKNLLQWIVEKHNEAISTAFPDSLAGRLSVVCDGAPKIRALLHIIADVVVLHKKKLLIFCTVPAQQLLVFAILKALDISVKVYYAGLDRKDKIKLQHDFNTTEDDPQVLIGTFATTSVGINLQAQCHWVLFLDPPPSIAVGEQAGGRCHRVGQTETVEVVTLITSRSFNDRQINNSLQKAIPGVVATLNKEVFLGAELKYDQDGVASVDLGEWVSYNGKLLQSDDPSLPLNHGLAILQDNDVVYELIEKKMGARVGWRDDVEEDDEDVENVEDDDEDVEDDDEDVEDAEDVEDEDEEDDEEDDEEQDDSPGDDDGDEADSNIDSDK